MLPDFPGTGFTLSDLYFADGLRQECEGGSGPRQAGSGTAGVTPWIGFLRPRLPWRCRIPRADVDPSQLRDELTNYVTQWRASADAIDTFDAGNSTTVTPSPRE